MRFKKIGAALLACAMCFGVFSTTAFAYVDESVATEEPAVEEKVPETEPEEPMLPLTPCLLYTSRSADRHKICQYDSGS